MILYVNCLIVFYAKKTDSDSLKAQYEKFLKEILILKAKEYFAKWEKITGLKSTSLTIRKTVSRWGSCNSLTGAINLSLYLACLPEFCLDYVILHELCHLKYANHGEYFKRELDKYMPNSHLKFNDEEYCFSRIHIKYYLHIINHPIIIKGDEIVLAILKSFGYGDFSFLRDGSLRPIDNED